MGLTDLRVEEQNLAQGDLTLEARDGESLEVMAHGIVAASAGAIATVSIREETMLAYQADDGDDLLLPAGSVQDLQMNFLGVLRQKGLTAPTLKVPEGQELQVSTSSNDGFGFLLYKELDADAVGGDDPGAPGTKDRVFVSSGQTTQNIGANATETVELEDTVNPSQLASFPYGEDGPSGFEHDLLAVMVELDDTADPDHILDDLRLSTLETDFLSRRSQRVQDTIAPYPDRELRRLPLHFPEPPTIGPGQELDLEVEVTDTGGAAADTVVNSAHIFHRRPVGGGA